MLDLQLMLQKSISQRWSQRRKQIITMRYTLYNLIQKLYSGGLDLSYITNLNEEDYWKLIAYPWWSCSNKLSDGERSINKRIKFERNKIKPAFQSGQEWHNLYCKEFGITIKMLYNTNEDPDMFWTLYNMDYGLLNLKNSFKTLKRLWSSRDRRCDPPSHNLALLPNHWQNGVKY